MRRIRPLQVVHTLFAVVNADGDDGVGDERAVAAVLVEQFQPAHHHLHMGAAVRERGYAMDLGEEELGVHCMAVPVRDGSRVVGAMSVSGPAERIDALDRDWLAEGLGAIAGEFGKELGPEPSVLG